MSKRQRVFPWTAVVALCGLIPLSTFGQAGPPVPVPTARTTVDTAGWDMSDAPSIGAPSAPARMILFLDYQCPYSAQLFGTVRSVLAGSQGSLQVQVFHYPLNTTCNSHVTSTVFQGSCHGASGAICAQEQGRFWEMSDRLFADRNNMSPAAVLEHARQLSLDMNAFGACMGSTLPTTRITRDTVLGVQVPVSGTPTMIVNGRDFGGAMAIEPLRVLIKHLTDNGGAWSTSP